MDYKEIVKDYADYATPDKIMNAMSKLDDAMDFVAENDMSQYLKTMRKVHEVFMGNHYNKEFAKHDVSMMKHTRTDGSKFIGEHWNIDQVKEIMKSQPVPSSYNCWDVYVALNGNWHDKDVLFKKWFPEPEKHENKIIEDAISFYFKDEDAPDGKIWIYQCAMHK